MRHAYLKTRRAAGWWWGIIKDHNYNENIAKSNLVTNLTDHATRPSLKRPFLQVTHLKSVTYTQVTLYTSDLQLRWNWNYCQLRPGKLHGPLPSSPSGSQWRSQTGFPSTVALWFNWFDMAGMMKVASRWVHREFTSVSIKALKPLEKNPLNASLASGCTRTR